MLGGEMRSEVLQHFSDVMELIGSFIKLLMFVYNFPQIFGVVGKAGNSRQNGGGASWLAKLEHAGLLIGGSQV